MKHFLLFSSLLFTLVSQQALANRSQSPLAFECTAHDYRLTVGKMQSVGNYPYNPEIPQKSSRVTLSNKRGQTLATYDGVGELTEWKANLTLLQGGDMAMGTLEINYGFGHWVGNFQVRIRNTQTPIQFVCFSKQL